MCFILTAVLLILGVSFYMEGNMVQAWVMFGMATPLMGLIAWRIFKLNKN